MNTLRLLCSFFVLTVAAVAADPTGTWKWAVSGPNGPMETILKLESRDGKLAGSYSNQFGPATISNASFEDNVLAFEVQREFNGAKFVIKYRGKLEGDTIKGTLEFPTPDGASNKLDWNATRTPPKS